MSSAHSLANQCTNITGGISRLWCETCAEERLHRNGVCSCGARHVGYPVRDLYEMKSSEAFVRSSKRGSRKVQALGLAGRPSRDSKFGDGVLRGRALEKVLRKAKGG